MSEQHLGPPPVEPLSEIAWTRVERGIFARLDGTATTTIREPRSRRVWLWLAVPAIATAAVAATIVGKRPAPRVASQEAERVVAGAAASAVSFGDAHVTLDAHSALVMDHDGDRPTALLERGAAWFSVAPRGKRPPFMVRAGDAIVRVVGTRFRVARDGERADVVVDHGIVEVRFRGSLVRLTAGEAWSSLHPSQVEHVDALPPEPSLEAQAEEDDEPPPVEPPPAVPVRAAHHHRRHHAAPAAPTRTDDARAPRANEPDRARYEGLTKLEATRPEVAMKGYLALSQGHGKWAEVALYAAGRLAADRHDPRAKTLLSIYLDRFPHGANAADARQLLIRIKGETP